MLASNPETTNVNIERNTVEIKNLMDEGYETWRSDKANGLILLSMSLYNISKAIKADDESKVDEEALEIQTTIKLLSTSAWEISHKMIVKMEIVLTEVKKSLNENDSPGELRTYAARGATATKNGAKMIDRISEEFKKIVNYVKSYINKFQEENNADKYTNKLNSMLEFLNDPSNLVAAARNSEPVSVAQNGDVKNIEEEKERPIEPKVEQVPKEAVNVYIIDLTAQQILNEPPKKVQFVEVNPEEMPESIDVAKTNEEISKMQKDIAEFDSKSKAVKVNEKDIKSSVTNFWDTLVGGFKKGMRKLGNFFKNTAGKVKNFFSKFLFDESDFDGESGEETGDETVDETGDETGDETSDDSGDDPERMATL